MKQRITISLVVFFVVLILYWIGVYLSGIPMHRSTDISTNYGFSLLISLIVAVFTASCPLWDNK